MLRSFIVLLALVAGCATTDPQVFLREFVSEGSGCPEGDIELVQGRFPAYYQVYACGATVRYRVECGSFRCVATRVSPITPDKSK
jgi:hypothetical protein